MLELTIKATSPEELRLQLLGFLAKMKDINLFQNGNPVDTTPLDKVPVTEEPVKTPEVKPEITAEPVNEIKPVITQEQMAENQAKAPVHEEPQPTIEDTRQALKALRDRKGSAAVKELLKAFHADSLPELKPEDYLSVIGRAEVEV